MEYGSSWKYALKKKKEEEKKEKEVKSYSKIPSSM